MTSILRHPFCLENGQPYRCIAHCSPLDTNLASYIKSAAKLLCMFRCCSFSLALSLSLVCSALEASLFLSLLPSHDPASFFCWPSFTTLANLILSPSLTACRSLLVTLQHHVFCNEHAVLYRLRHTGSRCFRLYCSNTP